MRSRFARVAGVLTVLTVALVTTVVNAGTATAAVSCSGHVSYSRTFSLGPNNPIAELVIYYNSADGGTNSACFYHRGASYGVQTLTNVRIWRCWESSGPGQSCTRDGAYYDDTGQYAYYAGPVGVTGTANRCVAAEGYIIWNGAAVPIETGRRGC
jgi:hypothetical protein